MNLGQEMAKGHCENFAAFRSPQFRQRRQFLHQKLFEWDGVVKASRDQKTVAGTAGRLPARDRFECRHAAGRHRDDFAKLEDCLCGPEPFAKPCPDPDRPAPLDVKINVIGPKSVNSAEATVLDGFD
jgi:hypothetical protein